MTKLPRIHDTILSLISRGLAISVHSGNQIFSSKAGISPLLIRKELKSTASTFPTKLSEFMLRTESLEKGVVPRWPN